MVLSMQTRAGLRWLDGVQNRPIRHRPSWSDKGNLAKELRIVVLRRRDAGKLLIIEREQ